MAGRHEGFAYRLAVLVLRPLSGRLARHEWSGREHLPPAGGVVVVGNHLSHVDPLFLAHFLHDSGRAPRFLAKAVLFRVPVVGRLLLAAGQIPVERQSADAAHAFSAALAAVRAGECVVIYPEATLTRDPGLWPMVGKSGAARVALATGVPVVPVAQWGAQQILAPYRRRVRLWPRPTVRVVAGPVVDLSDYTGRELSAELLEAATERVQAAVTRLLAELRGEPAPVRRFDLSLEGGAAAGRPHRRLPRRPVRGRRG